MGNRFGGRQSFAPVREGEELDVKIEAVGEKGDGIAKVKGFVLFVPNSICRIFWGGCLYTVVYQVPQMRCSAWAGYWHGLRKSFDEKSKNELLSKLWC